MSFIDPSAYGEAGKRIRDIQVVNTRGGTQPHLAWVGVGLTKTFCGLQAARLSRTWFEITGCAKCRRSAVHQGVATITDVDGQRIDL